MELAKTLMAIDPLLFGVGVALSIELVGVVLWIVLLRRLK